MVVMVVLTEMQSTEAPVVQLSEEVPRTDALREVELPLAVQAEDVLEDLR